MSEEIDKYKALRDFRVNVGDLSASLILQRQRSTEINAKFARALLIAASRPHSKQKILFGYPIDLSLPDHNDLLTDREELRELLFFQDKIKVTI